MRESRAPLARRPPPLAYASVGKSGDFGASAGVGDSNAQTWTFTFGLGWLYGLGVCIGPFFGTGVGLTFPGGVLAGAGGGVGVVVGIGMGGGFVWGSGRGNVQGFGVIPPMQPPFADGGFPRPSDLPPPAEVARRAAKYLEDARARAGDFARSKRRAKPKPAFVRPAVLGGRRAGAWRSGALVDPRWGQ